MANNSDQNIETELKLLIEPSNICDILQLIDKNMAYLKKPRTYELSIMYDNEAGLMQTTDGRIRVRQSGDTVEFCYKKPLTREVIKQEIEYEVTISDQEQLDHILKEMGFQPTTSYERYRTEFLLNRVKITLDEYPFAVFIELEGNTNEIIYVANLLNLDLKANLTDSCDTLFTRWRQDKGLSPIPHMRFDDFNR